MQKYVQQLMYVVCAKRDITICRASAQEVWVTKRVVLVVSMDW